MRKMELGGEGCGEGVGAGDEYNKKYIVLNFQKINKSIILNKAKKKYVEFLSLLVL